MKIDRSVIIDAPLPDVWAIVSEPKALSRWWPRVERVELGEPGAFTQVMRTPKGKTVRADYVFVELDPPRLVRMEQEIEDTPFARVLTSLVLTIELQERKGGTEVRIEQDQELKGSSKFGGFMLKGATRDTLDGALAGLKALFDDGVA